MNDQPITKASFVAENAPKILISLLDRHTQMTGNIQLDDMVEYERMSTATAIVMFENIQLQTESEAQKIMRLAKLSAKDQ